LPDIHLTGLISRIYKELKKLIGKEAINPINKWTMELNSFKGRSTKG
jgi:hypothetical protein